MKKPDKASLREEKALKKFEKEATLLKRNLLLRKEQKQEIKNGKA
ncbi:MAG: hypothetical protein PHI50_01220 [Alphaproteobacteria bacterium]|nr:hypothetical protein [Alphaproteobacteria bacterium]